MRLLEKETLFLLCQSPREHGSLGPSWVRIIRGTGKGCCGGGEAQTGMVWISTLPLACSGNLSQ